MDWGNESLFNAVMSIIMTIHGKSLRKIFRTRWQTLKLGIQHWVLKTVQNYQDSSKDDLSLSFDLFTKKIEFAWNVELSETVEVYYTGSESESESELLLVTRSNDNHSPGPVMREVSP